MNNSKTIVLCGGGTAGHIIPNIALVPELKKYFSRIVYFGEKNSLEYELATQAGLEFVQINSIRFNRENVWKNLKIPFVLSRYVLECKKILKMLSPSVIFSKGGYVSLPVILAGKKLDIPYCIHESDATIGLANKVVAKDANFVFTNFPNTYSGKNTVVTGIPMRNNLFSTKSSAEILNSLHLSNRKTILIVGGSLGSQKINETVIKILPDLLKTYNVIHLTGKGKKQSYSSPGYVQFEFFDSIGELYKVSNVVISRAGATTISELKALGKKAILIPLSKNASRGDQIKNAERMLGSPSFVVLDEDTLSSLSLKKAIDGLILTPELKIKSFQNPSIIISQILSKI